MPLDATVHYGQNYDNAFWNGKQMISGDGDGELFNRFTIAIDVTAKEFANGVVQAQTKLVYWQQSGALYNSIASVFACLVKQYVHQQTADQADWLLGAGLFTPEVESGHRVHSLPPFISDHRRFHSCPTDAMRPTTASLLCASKGPASSIAPFSAVAGVAGVIVTRNT
jgi:hypothetical protein